MIKELFEKRDTHFNNISKEIFDSIPNVLDGCMKFVSKQGTNAATLKWDNVSFLEDDNVVVLVGTILYSPGDEIELPNGEIVEITEDTAEYFRAMIRLGIPYDLAINGTEDDIYVFLSETMDIESEDGIVGEHPIETQDDEVEHISLDDFNLNSLSDDQQKAMALFLATQNEKGSIEN